MIVIKNWIRIALVNLLIVSMLGVTMRYKIAYSLPFIDQKKFLHAHSHFAFAGWITMALMVLLVAYLMKQQGILMVKKYKWILLANLITAYGMLFSFPFQGYGVYSITSSTLSIFISYVFAFMFWKDLNRLPEKNISHSWLKAAVLFNAISSIGAFTLSGMMITKTIHQNWYLHSVYFFLHFQYNGWFFFACMGLVTDKLSRFGLSTKSLKIVFWLFATACIPAYLLSVLWVKIPTWTYIIVVMSSLAQVAGWLIMLKIIYKALAFIKTFGVTARRLLFLSAVALSIKLLLQLGSTIPSVSQLAFGFRPIVIAYLHLVLLGVITLFIISEAITDHFIMLNKKMVAGVFIFTAGIILNEAVLMLQGISDINYVSIPYINETLLVIAIMLFFGILLLNISQLKSKSEPELSHSL
ncbi:MAG: hypothetical protein ABJA57_06230 [Ginsengibacter sp.]